MEFITLFISYLIRWISSIMNPEIGGFPCPFLVLYKGEYKACGHQRVMNFCKNANAHRICACGKAREISEANHSCDVKPQERKGLETAILMLDLKYCKCCNGTKDKPNYFKGRICQHKWHETPQYIPKVPNAPLKDGRFHCTNLVSNGSKIWACKELRTMKWCPKFWQHCKCACGKAQFLNQIFHNCTVEPEERDSLRLAILFNNDKFCRSCNSGKDVRGYIKKNKVCPSKWHSCPLPLHVSAATAAETVPATVVAGTDAPTPAIVADATTAETDNTETTITPTAIPPVIYVAEDPADTYAETDITVGGDMSEDIEEYEDSPVLVE